MAETGIEVLVLGLTTDATFIFYCMFAILALLVPYYDTKSFKIGAATEQVTASAEQVREMSENNLDFAEQVKDSIGVIEGTAEKLKQYI